MSDLYRIDHSKGFPAEIEEALEDGWLVPAVPCEHGRWEGHKDGVVITEYAPNGEASRLEVGWCPGAGLGVEEDKA